MKNRIVLASNNGKKIRELGAILAASDIPDPAFAAGALGASFAINPADGTVRSPVNGQIATPFPPVNRLAEWIPAAGKQRLGNK